MDEPAFRWKGRRVLVTGCTGFLGGSVVRELLSAGAEVVGLIRDRAGDAEFARHRLAGRVHVAHGRVEDTFRLHTTLAVHEATAVFHFASPAEPAEPDRGTAAVLEAVWRYDPRTPVITARPVPAATAEPLPPPLPVGIARFGELFGGGDRKTYRVVPATVIEQITGDRPPAPRCGGPRDFVYIADAARACLRLAEAVAARPVPHVHDATFRSGWLMTEWEMAAAVRETVAGRAVERPTTPPDNPLEWRPSASFADSLGETVAWYRDFLRSRFFGTRPTTDPQHRAAA